MEITFIAMILFLVHVQLIQNYSYITKYIEVPLDHFSFTNSYMFKLRYFVNDSYWSDCGPIFFYTGNEGNIETFAENSGFMWELAPAFRALLVFAEHRYYGESLPFGNASFSNPKRLGYLTSSQALADYVYLLQYLGKYCKKENPVIAFGGSYGGMLSAWLRMKYPSSVWGAVASSAPIWQFQGLVSCEIFNKIITFVFDISSLHKCPKIIKRSWSAIRVVTSTSSGRRWLSTDWKLCKALTTPEDIHTLTDWLEEVYGNLAMANYPYETDFIVPLPAHPVKVFCDRLFCSTSSEPEFLLHQLGKALSVYTNYTGNTRCIDVSQSPNGSLGDIGWDFQACTEMIMPMCSGDLDMFENESWNFTKYAEDCYKKWKVGVRRADSVVLEYGGKDLKTTSNIIFSNGLLDPWSGGGVLNDASDSVLAVVMPDVAHHLDLRASNPADPSSVRNARKFYIRVISEWLQKYYKEH
ncbi:hypothetical protein ILUMI_09299 [Ignelater luminosus]|uniref:Lysosomal Pro-X carboxypeptidase n=1 Tax=Ignelater luminosus TaxID=2038154 RepID=A0A8K0D447_IGNLU|nr:hypothetical protein ILUMI_09299 [Ignelater luminosus]